MNIPIFYKQWILLLLITCTSMLLLPAFGFIDGFHRHRNKRNAFKLAEQIQCATANGTRELSLVTLYKKLMTYGCWCGLGGEGEPVDKIDECCMKHDTCYNTDQKNGVCGFFQPYFSIYSYQSKECGSDDLVIKCKTKKGTCAGDMCECDRKIALCLNDAWSTYDEKYINYLGSDYCKESSKRKAADVKHDNDEDAITSKSAIDKKAGDKKTKIKNAA